MEGSNCTLNLPTKIEDLQTPCLLVDIDRVKHNCEKMILRCKEFGIGLRPHMKTHKCLEAGMMMTGGSKRCIVTSTLSEAEFFANGSFDDILYGVIFSENKMKRIFALSNQLEKFCVMLDNDYGVQLLEKYLPPQSKKWNAFLKVDCGNARAGIPWDSDNTVYLAKKLAKNPNVNFEGLYAHDGNTYGAKGEDAIHKIAAETTDRIQELAKKIRDAGVQFTTVSIGSTPSGSKPSDNMRSLTEIHPGNYVFYDVMQSRIQSCTEDDIAVRVATRVIGHYPHRRQMLIDCGFTGLSQDGKGQLEDGAWCIIEGHPKLRMKKMSQEVGWVDLPSDGSSGCEDYPLGSILMLLPHHSCATCCMHRIYYIHEGDHVTTTWKPCDGW